MSSKIRVTHTHQPNKNTKTKDKKDVKIKESCALLLAFGPPKELQKD